MEYQKRTLLILVIAILSFCSCTSEEPNSTDEQLSDYEFYISGKLDGVPFLYGFDSDASESDYIPGIGFLSNVDININSCKYSYQAGLDTNLDETLPSGNFVFNKFYDDNCSNQLNFFNNLFPQGIKKYASNENEKGMIYEFNDGNGNFYSTVFGSQSESNFEITNSEEDNRLLIGDLYSFNQKIKGTFNCKLYNEQTSEIIEITEGKFIVAPQATINGILN